MARQVSRTAVLHLVGKLPPVPGTPVPSVPVAPPQPAPHGISSPSHPPPLGVVAVLSHVASHRFNDGGLQGCYFLDVDYRCNDGSVARLRLRRGATGHTSTVGPAGGGWRAAPAPYLALTLLAVGPSASSGSTAPCQPRCGSRPKLGFSGGAAHMIAPVVAGRCSRGFRLLVMARTGPWPWPCNACCVGLAGITLEADPGRW